MTVDPARLLQMLEPTVRPGNTSAASGAQQGKPAFENRTFDDLLNEAKTTQADGTEAGKTAPAKADPLVALGGLGQVENAALRKVLAQSRGMQSGLGTAETE
ncbi:MAG: hypothetical protein AAF085_08760 [Planctomycetota bacterium]